MVGVGIYLLACSAGAEVKPAEGLRVQDDGGSNGSGDGSDRITSSSDLSGGVATECSASTTETGGLPRQKTKNAFGVVTSVSTRAV